MLNFLRELVAEAESVVVEAEADNHYCGLVDTLAFVVEVVVLHQRDGEFVVVVADVGFLAPYGMPGFVEGGALHMAHAEAGSEVTFAPLEFESHW